jgi:hypothetical protein
MRDMPSADPRRDALDFGFKLRPLPPGSRRKPTADLVTWLYTPDAAERDRRVQRALDEAQRLRNLEKKDT